MKKKGKDVQPAERTGIGRKISELRRKKNYTLDELAEMTDTRKSVLGKIESDEAVPPLGTLLKLSRTLDVSMAYFFDDEVVMEKIFLTRGRDRTRVNVRSERQEGEVHYSYEPLEPKNPYKHIEPFLVRFEPGEASDILYMNHEGEEFHFVLEGKLEFRTDDRVEVLEAGDSLFFESDMNHGFRALGDIPAKVIVVVWSRPGDKRDYQRK